MTRIYKYVLDDIAKPAEIEMQIGAKVLHVDVQGSVICLWASVEIDRGTEKRTFLVFGTGHNIPHDCEYVGTVLMPPFVWHIHEVKS